jgi:hypothetical protein
MDHILYNDNDNYFCARENKNNFPNNKLWTHLLSTIQTNQKKSLLW